MSKVFSAQRQEVTAEYEFLNGDKKEFKIVSLSTKESRELSEFQKDETVTVGDFLEKQIAFMLQKNDKQTLDTILEEQMSEGNILDFAKALNKEIAEQTQEKGND